MHISKFFRNSQLLILMMMIGLAHFLVDTMLGIWPVYKSLVQINIAKAGLIVACGAFIGEGAQLFFGSLSDRGHRKSLIIIGLLTSMAASFLAYFTHDLTLFTLFLITCIGSGCFHPCAASLVSGLVPSHRGLFMTIFAACGSLGLATSQLTFTHVRTLLEGQTFVLALPAIALAIAFFFYRLPPAAAQIQKKSDRPSASFRDFSDFFHNPSLRFLYISQVANQSITWGTIFILPDILKTLEHCDWICYGGGHLCFILGATCMMIPGGFLADLYSPRKVMLYGGVVSFISFYFILLSGGISGILVLAVLFILGATLMLMNPLALAMGARLEPNRSGAVSAFLMGLVWCVSESLGPGGVGLMTNFFDEQAPIKALAILGTLFIVQIYATLRLPTVPALVPAST